MFFYYKSFSNGDSIDTVSTLYQAGLSLTVLKAYSFYIQSDHCFTQYVKTFNIQ